MNDVERLLAYEEIRQLASHYALYVDSRNIDKLVALFTPDVKVGGERGRAALHASMSETLRDVGVSVLNIGTHAIALDAADHAHGFVYCHGQVVQEGKWVIQAIQYQDRYERVDGHWLFERRKHLLFYGAHFGVNPLDVPKSGWPELTTGRGSVPESFESWQKFWSED